MDFPMPHPKVECRCFFKDTLWKNGCLCGPSERILRGYADGSVSLPMTPEQRQWCANETDRAGEGATSVEEALSLPDRQLAKHVLRMWADYVRSQF